MKVGVVLPVTLPGSTPSLLLEWARRADSASFSSLGVIDRLVYPGYDPLMALAAAAAVTNRIRLMPTILIAPLHPTGVLAKQVLSLDALSGGRLSLGVGVGIRDDDFIAAPSTYTDRGSRFERQLRDLRHAWTTGRLEAEGPVVGPPSRLAGESEILIGGYSPAAIRRVGCYGDGFIAGSGLDLPTTASLYGIARAAWEEEGRPGRPRFVGVGYFALGSAAQVAAPDYLRHYYAFLGPLADTIATSVPRSSAALADHLAGAAAIGMDELVLAPCAPSIEELDRLTSVVAGLETIAADGLR